MSDEQPQPGAGGEPPDSPFGKHGQAPPPGNEYGDNPYGDAFGARDPLTGMPPLASRLRRLVARVIDALLVAVVSLLIIPPLLGGYDEMTEGGTYLQGAATVLIYFVYDGVMLTTRGQTVGKMAMRIRVGMLDDGSVPSGGPGWLRAAVYALPQLVPYIGFPFWLINVLFCTWDQPYHQCLHDKAAKTVVVDAR